MGIMGSTETSLPNETLPRIAPTRPTAAWILKAVDLYTGLGLGLVLGLGEGHLGQRCCQRLGEFAVACPLACLASYSTSARTRQREKIIEQILQWDFFRIWNCDRVGNI
jgi:hypothetical protein